jgi:small-conductance mechanosensitive channel
MEYHVSTPSSVGGAIILLILVLAVGAVIAKNRLTDLWDRAPDSTAQRSRAARWFTKRNTLLGVAVVLSSPLWWGLWNVVSSGRWGVPFATTIFAAVATTVCVTLAVRHPGKRRQ